MGIIMDFCLWCSISASPGVKMVRMEMEGNSKQDMDLVELARGDPEAFARLYEAYFPRVYGYVSSRVASPESAEDLTADVFVRLVQSLSSFERRQSGSFAGWLFRIAHNLTLNYYREVERDRDGRERSEEVGFRLPVVLTPEEEFMQKDRSATMRRMIASLPERRREIITLRFYGELRNQEIAEVLGLDERTVASHLSRGLRDLHDLWVAETRAETVQIALETGAHGDMGETKDVRR